MKSKLTLIAWAGFWVLPLMGQSNLRQDTVEELKQAMAFWESYGDHCESMGLFPSKNEEDGRCDDGDALLFNGLLCMASYQPSCDAVRRSLDASGQWWRSPRQVGGALRDKNSFSRDMAMGALLYLTKTDDKDAAQLWLRWLEHNRKALKIGAVPAFQVSFLCHDDENLTCAMTPAVWENLARVWISIGLSPTSSMQRPYSQFGSVGQWVSTATERFGYDWQDMAKLELKNTKPGYQMHLKGVLAYLTQKINQKAGFELYSSRALSASLHQLQPDNLFFQYLHQGPSEGLARTLLERCPSPMTQAPKRQWAWERADANTAWRQSMGWDCFFLGRLLLGYDTLERPEVPAELPSAPQSRQRVVKDLLVSEPAESLAASEPRQDRIHQICLQRVERDIQAAREITGIDFQISDPIARNWRFLEFNSSEGFIRAYVDCHYQIQKT